MEQFLTSQKGKTFMWHSVFWILLGLAVGWLATFFAGASAGDAGNSAISTFTAQMSSNPDFMFSGHTAKSMWPLP